MLRATNGIEEGRVAEHGFVTGEEPAFGTDGDGDDWRVGRAEMVSMELQDMGNCLLGRGSLGLDNGQSFGFFSQRSLILE